MEYKKPEFIKDLGMLKINPSSKKARRYHLFKCECGKEFKCEPSHIKRGVVKSCGCYNRKASKERSTKHGLNGHPIHCAYTNMKQRCLNKNHKSYKNYGGRGITICEEWANDFNSFSEWCFSNGWEKGLSIDRIDNNEGYSPENCRWTDRTTQNRNTRLLQSNNTTGYRGVCFEKRRNRFIATIRLHGKTKFILSSKCRLFCAYAYDKYIEDNNLEHTKNFTQ